MFKYKKSRLSAFFAAINIVLADIGGKKTTYIISFRAKSIIIMSVSVVMLVACERMLLQASRWILRKNS